MRQSVRDIFVPFTQTFEGKLDGLYLDVKCLATAGIGNLADPVSLSLAMPWVRRSDLSPATLNEIQEEWIRIKEMTHLAPQGGAAFMPFTTLKLTEAGIASVVAGRLNLNESLLAKRWPNLTEDKVWDWFPADAQLACHSIAWAAGANWVAPKFDGYARRCDLVGMADESAVHTARDATNRGLLLAAAKTVAEGGDFDMIHWSATK
jgi:hypothetical protein